MFCSIRYSNSFLYSRFKRLVQRSNGARERDAMRQHMASLSVEAYDLRVIKPEDEWAVAMTATRGPATPGLRSSQVLVASLHAAWLCAGQARQPLRNTMHGSLSAGVMHVICG